MSHPIIMSSERPVHKTLESTSRSIVWKIKFLAKGVFDFKSGVFKFIFSSIRAKYFWLEEGLINIDKEIKMTSNNFENKLQVAMIAPGHDHLMKSMPVCSSVKRA